MSIDIIINAEFLGFLTTDTVCPQTVYSEKVRNGKVPILKAVLQFLIFYKYANSRKCVSQDSRAQF